MPQENLTIVTYPKRSLKRVKSRRGDGISLSVADRAFSHYVIARDKFCQFPGCMVSDPAKLTCSHYIGRANKGVRFYPDNCIALCRTHHYWDKQLGWEFQKQRYDVHGWDGQYTLHMQKRLTKRRFAALLSRAHKKIKLRYALTEFQGFITANPTLFPQVDPLTFRILKVV